MTRPGIEPRSLGPLANTLPTTGYKMMPMNLFIWFTDWLYWWYFDPSKVISCLEVRESRSLNIDIYILYSCFLRVFFPTRFRLIRTILKQIYLTHRMVHQIFRNEASPLDAVYYHIKKILFCWVLTSCKGNIQFILSLVVNAYINLCKLTFIHTYSFDGASERKTVENQRHESISMHKEFWEKNVLASNLLKCLMI